MKQIPLNQGKFAIIDDEDFDYLSQFKWHITKKGRKEDRGYAKKKFCIDGVWGNKKMEVFILHLLFRSHFKIKHLNGDKLDNRKENLRVSTKESVLLQEKEQVS